MRAIVNQKLYFARLTLDQASQIESGEAGHIALLQAGLFHLVTAYRCYLREIAGLYQLSLAADDADTALRQLSERQVPELIELAALERGDTWLAHLLRAYREACIPKPVAVVSQASNIPLTNITESLTCSIGRDWLDALRHLIDEQRGRVQEW